MRRFFMLLATVLVVVDVAAFYVWWTHTHAAPSAPPAASTPAEPPAPREPLSTPPPLEASAGPDSAPSTGAAFAAAELSRRRPGAGTLTPGGCRSVEECSAYCGKPENQDECAKFATGERPRRPSEGEGRPAEESRPEGEQDGARPPGPEASERGRGPKRNPKDFAGPGGCTDPESCKSRCSEPAHFEECLASEQVPEEFKAMIRSGMERGRGGGEEGGDGEGEGEGEE